MWDFFSSCFLSFFLENEVVTVILQRCWVSAVLAALLQLYIGLVPDVKVKSSSAVSVRALD
jgi:hypothetical protein